VVQRREDAGAGLRLLTAPASKAALGFRGATGLSLRGQHCGTVPPPSFPPCFLLAFRLPFLSASSLRSCHQCLRPCAPRHTTLAHTQ